MTSASATLWPMKRNGMEAILHVKGVGKSMVRWYDGIFPMAGV